MRASDPDPLADLDPDPKFQVRIREKFVFCEPISMSFFSVSTNNYCSLEYIEIKK
jgi:hypothetical protein